jgi:ligand-binding sensor domain-containing protein
MPLGFPSLRVDRDNALHHLWCNNGTWWVHYTLHFGHRKRRIRRSLETSTLDEAVRRRDALLARLAVEGETVADRRAVQGVEQPEVCA